MATTTKAMKEVKPKIKEYARSTDYIDAVAKKTYDVLKDVDRDKKLFYKGRTDYHHANNVEIDGGYSNQSMPIITYIDTRYAYIKVRVDTCKSDEKGCNTELTVTRKDPKYGWDFQNIDIYNEVEKRLNAGLERFKHAKVTSPQKKEDGTILVDFGKKA